jgi:hypothetical protein
LPKFAKPDTFSLLHPAFISHCFYVEVKTIEYADYAFASVPSGSAAVNPVTGPSELKAAVFSAERKRTSVLNRGMLLLKNVSMQPPQSHPVDRLLPQSRLQRMKRLLQQ